MTEAMFFRFGRQNWLGVYAFMFLKERNNTLDYAAKNMKLYAVRLWFPEYVDAEKTKIVLNIFEGEFTRHVRRSLSRHSRRCAAINVYILLSFFLAFVPGYYLSNCLTKCLYPTAKVREMKNKETIKWNDKTFQEIFYPDDECVEYHIWQFKCCGMPGT